MEETERKYNKYNNYITSFTATFPHTKHWNICTSTFTWELNIGS